jgi:hypothetical protein
MSMATLIFAALMALTEFLFYGNALLTVRGIVGVIVKTVIFAVLVSSIVRADISDSRPPDSDQRNE